MERSWESRWNKLITLGLICTAVYFFVVYIAQYNNVYFAGLSKPVGAVITSAILLGAMLVIYIVGKWLLTQFGDAVCRLQVKEWKLVLLVIALAVIPRLLAMQVLQFPLESDYLNYFNNAATYAETGVMPVDGYYLVIVPNSVLYTTVMGLVFRAFGAETSVALMMNLVIFTGAAVFFYLAVRKLVPQGFALIGAVFFCCNPMFLYYSLVLSIEPFGTLFLMMGLYFYLCWDRDPDAVGGVDGKGILFALLAGAAFSVANFTRPNAMIFLIAIAISAVLRPRKHRFVLLAATLVGYFLFGEVLNAFRNDMLRAEVAGLGFGWTLFEGLDPTTYGVWCAENSEVMSRTIAENPYDEVQGILLQYALERASTFDVPTWIDLILGKGGNVWVSCGDYIEANITTSVVAMGYEAFHVLEMAAYMLLVLVFTKGKLSRRLDTHLLVLYLFPVGMMILHSFATSIPRYRYLAMPFLYAAAMMMLYGVYRDMKGSMGN